MYRHFHTNPIESLEIYFIKTGQGDIKRQIFGDRWCRDSWSHTNTRKHDKLFLNCNQKVQNLTIKYFQNIIKSKNIDPPDI